MVQCSFFAHLDLTQIDEKEMNRRDLPSVAIASSKARVTDGFRGRCFVASRSPPSKIYPASSCSRHLVPVVPSRVWLYFPLFSFRCFAVVRGRARTPQQRPDGVRPCDAVRGFWSRGRLFLCCFLGTACLATHLADCNLLAIARDT